MSHFAEISGSTVIRVLVAEQDFIDSGVVGDPANWIQTSYTNSIRKNFAGIGYTYDESRDAFIPQKPFDSWTLDEDSCQWKSPVEYPGDGKILYTWNESSLAWEEI